MIGHPLNATEWNERLSTEHGESIVETLAPWYEQELYLGDPRTFVSTGLKNALAAFGEEFAPNSVETMSEMEMRVFSDLIDNAAPFRFTYWASQAIRHEEVEANGFYLCNEWVDLADYLHPPNDHLTILSSYEPIQSLSYSLRSDLHGLLAQSLWGDLGRPIGSVWSLDYDMRVSDDDSFGVYYNLHQLLIWQIAFIATGQAEEAAKIGAVTHFCRLGYYPWVVDEHNTLWVCTG